MTGGKKSGILRRSLNDTRDAVRKHSPKIEGVAHVTTVAAAIMGAIGFAPPVAAAAAVTGAGAAAAAHVGLRAGDSKQSEQTNESQVGKQSKGITHDKKTKKSKEAERKEAERKEAEELKVEELKGNLETALNKLSLELKADIKEDIMTNVVKMLVKIGVVRNSKEFEHLTKELGLDVEKEGMIFRKYKLKSKSKSKSNVTNNPIFNVGEQDDSRGGGYKINRKNNNKNKKKHKKTIKKKHKKTIQKTIKRKQKRSKRKTKRRTRHKTLR